MDPRLWSVIEHVDGVSPRAARRMAGAFLSLASPFNALLGARLLAWEPTRCRVRIARRRALTNHLRGMHAGALATAGETPAGLLLLKSFPFSRFRLILKDLGATYQRQARGDVFAEARLSDEALAQAKEGLERGEAQLVPVETSLTDAAGEVLAVVRTTWQLKSWSQVRSKS